jgi:plasmid rolling circle replication initiator protein Rep
LKNNQSEIKSQIPGSGEVQPGQRERSGDENRKVIVSAFPFSHSSQLEKLALDLPSNTPEHSPDVLLDTLETSEQAETLSAITDRKRHSVSLSRRIAKFDKKRSEVMNSCGQRFSRLVSKCEHKHTLSATGAFYCKDRLCPTCQRKRSFKLVHKLSSPLAELQLKNGLFASFITLTLKNTDKLPSFSDLSRWKKKLFKDKFWNSYGLFGAIGTLEVKLGERSGLWHVHFHLVVMTEKALPLIATGEQAGNFQLEVNQALSEAWEKANSGSGFIVRGKSFDGNYTEVLKYITKGTLDMTDGQLEEFCSWSKGRRFLSMTGKLYANKELKALLQQVEELEEETEQNACECPECKCKDFEKQDFVFDYHLKSYVLEKVSDFSFQREQLSALVR